MAAEMALKVFTRLDKKNFKKKIFFNTILMIHVFTYGKKIKNLWYIVEKAKFGAPPKKTTLQRQFKIDLLQACKWVDQQWVNEKRQRETAHCSTDLDLVVVVA